MLFLFPVDQPLPELEDKGQFDNTIQYYGPFSEWLRKFADSWGMFLDTEDSWNNDTFQQFYNDPKYGLQGPWYESPSNGSTFNRFFSRYLATPDQRPIASPNDTSVVVSPADSVPQGTRAIDNNSTIMAENGLKIKLVRYNTIEDLLGNDSEYKDAFADGVLTHTFLNVNDYHRYQVDTGEYGLVALIPMDMAQVSSVNFEDGVEVGSDHGKGEMLGNFLFGGSDFVMLFQKKAGFELTATPGIHILMGENYGVMNAAA